MTTTVIVVTVIVAGFLIISLIIWYDATKGTSGTCGLVKRTLLPDKCMGTCPTITSGLNSQCQGATTRPYGPFGWLGTQDVTCTCVHPTTGAALPGFPAVGAAGTAAGAGSGSAGGSTGGD